MRIPAAQDGGLPSCPAYSAIVLLKTADIREWNWRMLLNY